jgi:predicted esterase
VSSTRIDRAFQKFWAAKTSADAAAVIDEIVATRISFQETLRRLKKGRPYAPKKGGIIKLTNQTEDGVTHECLVKVPAGYDPQRRYPVRIQLHGDVHRAPDSQERDPTDMGPFDARDESTFLVRPFAKADTPWWSEDQILNLRAIVDSLKRDYNIDENRVVVAGESDGGTGAYYFGMRDTTPFASFLPANGFIMVLGNEGLTLNEQIFPNNLRNKPLFVVNGGRDPLYPTDTVAPYIDHMQKNGVAIDFHPQPETAWWPQVKPIFERFVAAHPRNPVPDRITWEVVQNDRWRRAHWLVIGELADSPEEPSPSIDAGRFTPKRGAANPFPLFAYQPPAGRVDIVRAGNLVTGTAEGVAEFTLLLSPDRIDFRRPVKVVVNDAVVFDGEMIPNVRMLLKWAAIDNDRTMLFAAELRVRLEA